MGFVDSIGWDPETTYWLVGAGAAILLTIAFFILYWWGTRYRDGHAHPPELPAVSESPLDAVSTASDASSAAPEVQPGSASAVASPVSHSQPLSAALANTRNSFFGRIRSLFGGRPALGASEMEELEEILYTSDLGPQTVQRLLETVQELPKDDGGGIDSVRAALKREMLAIFDGSGVTSSASSPDTQPENQPETRLRLVRDEETAPVGGDLAHLNLWAAKPAVLMVVGVNGAGKTTTIGKLSSRLAQGGKKVLVAAGDTFRAAAGNQLKVWTERAQVEIFNPENVTDPSAVGYAACEHARAAGFDVVIIDTAGRLHTQKNLMEELKKMKRVIGKLVESAPHEVLLVLDANSGQNALIQAREFHQALGVTGVVLTKLDGSAKGGVAIGLAYELKIPIKLIGVGEGIDDLRQFSSTEFVDSIL